MSLAVLPLGLPQGLSGKESACQCRRLRFDPWFGKIPQRRKWQPTPIFLPGKSRQRSLVGYGPRGHERVGHDLATEQQCFPEPSFLHFNFLIIDYSLVLFLLLSYKLLNAIGPLSVFSSPCLTPTCLAVGHLEVESVPPLEQLHSKQFFFLLA